jgi:hypothetical protein
VQKLEVAQQYDAAAASGAGLSLAAVTNHEGGVDRAEASKADPHGPEETRE